MTTCVLCAEFEKPALVIEPESVRPSDIDMTGLWACDAGCQVVVGLLEEAEDDDVVSVVPPYGWVDRHGDVFRCYTAYWSAIRRPTWAELESLDFEVVRRTEQAEIELRKCEALRIQLRYAYVMADSLKEDDE